MKTPAIGDRIRYRSVGSKPTIYEGRVCLAPMHKGCGPDVIHAVTATGSLHHVRPERVFAVLSLEPTP